MKRMGCFEKEMSGEDRRRRFQSKEMPKEDATRKRRQRTAAETIWVSRNSDDIRNIVSEKCQASRLHSCQKGCENSEMSLVDSGRDQMA